MKQFPFLYPVLLLTLFACNPKALPDLSDGKMVIQTGFEEVTDIVSGTRTYVTEAAGIRWADGEADKVLYVFDDKGIKHIFTSSETGESASRSFAGTLSEGSEVRWILWSGKVAADDQSTLVEETTTTGTFDGGYEPIGAGGKIQFQTRSGETASHTVFAGSSLRVVNPQNISHTNSFAQDANIAVMKPGDAALRSALGYIRFTVPAGDGGHATIKSVTFHADENLSGEIQMNR